MKKYILILAMSLAVFMSSCTDMLTENPTGVVDQSEYLDSKDDVERAIYAIYGILRTADAYGRYWPVIDIGTDEIGASSTKTDILSFVNHTLDGELEWFSSSGSWEIWWKGINYANYIIYNVSDADIDNYTDQERTAHIAEAMCMRAFFYFQLVRAWGDVPIIQWYVTDANYLYTMNLSRDKVDDVYTKLILPDLKFAAEYAPDTQALRGRATSWLAKVILSEAYMTYVGARRDSETGAFKSVDYGSEYWSLARDMAKDVVDNSPYYLLDNYSDNWDNDFSDESILEVGQIASSGMGSVLTRQCWYNRTGTTFWGGSTATPLSYEGNTSTVSEMAFGGIAVTGYYLPTPDLYHAMERYQEGELDENGSEMTAYHVKDKRSWGILTRFECSSGTYAGQTFLCTPTFTKYVDYDVAVGESGTSYGYADVNFVVYRYADALLLFAEAENEVNGPTSDAIEAVNKIRRRAGLSDLSYDAISSQSAFRDAIHQERKIELHAECKRRFDLIRWDKFKSETQSVDSSWEYTDNIMSREVFETYAEANSIPVSGASMLDWSYMTTPSVTYITIPNNGFQVTDEFYLLPIPTADLAKYSNWYQNKGYSGNY